MRKNDQIELTIVDQDDHGNGIGKLDGFPFFVQHAVTGDRVRAVITKLKKNYGYAKTLKVTEPSPFRRTAPCAECRRCGGCQLQEMDYTAQLDFKYRKVRSCLERIGGFRDIESVMEPVVPSDREFRYRNKAQFPVARMKDGSIAAGFYAGRTHDIIPVKDCMLVPESFSLIVERVLTWMRQNDIEPYDEKTGSGCVRHIFIRCSEMTGEHYICLVINEHDLPDEAVKDRLISSLKDAVPVCGIALNINRSRGNVILGDRIKVLYGDGFMTDSIGDVKYSISPLSFYQVNHGQTEKLYSLVKDFAGVTYSSNKSSGNKSSGNEGCGTVFDVYCGSGTIGLYLAKDFGELCGIEIVPDAVRDAEANACLNGIQNARFITGSAEEKLPGLVAEKGHADVIILDPPRKGCDKVTLDAVVKAAPDRIVYVSCDPATLSRDLKYLYGSGYEPVRVRPVDMFPETVHVETVCLLTHT